MTFRKSILLLISLSAIAALVACSSSSPAPVTVSLSSVPATVATNSSNSITATVANDSSNSGVVWTLSCTATVSGACGTISPASSPSGTAVSYIAPAFPATGVVITATSVASTSVSAAADTAVTGALLADGNYVFSVSGQDVNNGNYTVIGAITISGGAITAGEQDFTDFNDPDLFDQINPTGSSIASGADGNLTITLVTADESIGPDGSGIETFDGTILPLSTTGRTFITEFDGSASGSGELDLQDTTQFTAGTAPGPVSYAFAVTGLIDEGGEGAFFTVGGVIDVDGAAGTGTISGATSIFDANTEGESAPGNSLTSSTVSAADAFGRVQFALNPASDIPQFLLSGYIVDATHIRLVEGNDGSYDGVGGTTGGLGIVQNSADVAAFTNALGAGTYVLGLSGNDEAGAFQVATQLTLTSSGVAGFVDFNDIANSSGGGTETGVVSPDPVTAATYQVDGVAAGDYAIAGVTDGLGNTYNFQLYLDGNGNALTITQDETDNLFGVGFASSVAGAAGTLAASNFSGPYGLNTTGWDVAEDGELDAVGPTTADGVGTTTGTVDQNWLATPAETADIGVSGTFTAAADGIFTPSAITGLDVTTTSNADAFNYYVYDATGDSILIETDLNQLTLGWSAQQ
jgi:hypothetical protein